MYKDHAKPKALVKWRIYQQIQVGPFAFWEKSSVRFDMNALFATAFVQFFLVFLELCMPIVCNR